MVTGIVTYSISTVSDVASKKHLKSKALSVRVDLEDRDGNVVASGAGLTGELRVPNANLWWPYTMVSNDSQAGYLYKLVVSSILRRWKQLQSILFP